MPALDASTRRAGEPPIRTENDTRSTGAAESPSRGYPFLWRLAAVGLLVTFYYAWDWTPPRVWLADVAGTVLESLGHDTATGWEGTDLVLSADEEYYSITRDCTYADLILILIPLCWRTRRRFRLNLLRSGVIAVAVSACNLTRVVAAIHFNVSGVSWFAAHELPDLLFYYPLVGIAALLALRCDWRGPDG